jgi:copper homeostasis protein
MNKIVFELCAESIQACLAARDGGANRIELCSALSEGGLTPSHAFIREAVQRSGLPVYVLLRPRPGDFLYTKLEFAIMREDLVHARDLGASGFVVGILRPDETVDIERVSELVRAAAPLEVTFHRAFDCSASLDQALEDVISTGCSRVLTSGGQPDVVTGATTLAHLVKLAGDRIDVAVGGGLRITQAASIARQTGAHHFHGSLRRRRLGMAETSRSSELDETEELDGHIGFSVDADDIRAMISNLNNAIYMTEQQR